jgi:hypothetical protein
VSDSPEAGGAERLGHFRLERILGTGGFATVWLAYDEVLDAQVAIKVLAENWAHNDEIRRRFIDEARILWHMESPHIVRVHSVDTAADGRPYFVMEYADAGSLEDRMKERSAAGRPWGIEEAVAMSVDIADGLVDAQARDIIHRDLKPSNVLFRTSPLGTERLLLADFGIARSLEAAGATTIAAGTPHYMAPEQTEGRADRASDVYSAAVILFELLAGRVPFPYNSVGQVIRAQITEPAPDVATLRTDVPAGLALVLTQGLRADPGERQATAEQWRAELQRASSAPPVAAAAAVGLADAGATLGPEDIAAMRGDGPRGAAPVAGAAAGAAGAAAGAAAAGAATGPPPGPGRAGGPPGTVPPSGSGAPRGPTKRRRQLLAALMAIVLLAGVVTAISIASAGKATAEVFRVPVAATGPHPFTKPFVSPHLLTAVHLPFLQAPQSALGSAGKTLSHSIPAFTGDTPGLYGGTRQLAVCDGASMTRYLLANPDKLAAWARVEGIATSAVPSYIGGLTGVILRADTRLTNHGFVNGAATTIPEILQAGTGVLVDAFGVPRARCFCGNPLTPAVALPNVQYTGPSWPGFSAAKEAVVQAAQAVTKLVLVDVQTGVPFVRPVGTDGTSDTNAPPGALAGSPFAPPSSGVGGPAAASTVPGTYTAGTPTTSAGCSSAGVGAGSGSGKTFTAGMSGNTITLRLAGQDVSAPYDPSTGTFQVSDSGGSSGLSLGPSSLTGTFVQGPAGAVSAVLAFSLLGPGCTVTIPATRTSPLPGGTATTTAPATTSPPTTAAQPVDVTSQGTVSASSTYSSQYPPSLAVDGDPTTSWFSAGAGDGPSSTFTWQGPRNQLITSISITGNEHDADPNTRDHFGYAQTEIQVVNSAGSVVFDQTYQGPSDANRDITATVNATGQTVRLLLKNREDPSCGGFAELRVQAVA